MASRMDPVDIVTIGVGMTGIMLARELAPTGLKIVGIERGSMRNTVPDFQSPSMHDELRFSVHKGLIMDAARETFTFRNNTKQTALPLRRILGFLPGTGVGGSMVHWNAQTFRYQPADFIYRTHITERYGKDFADPELTIQDWGVTYDELEPHYDRFEYLCGTSGTAGNIKGKIMPGGNPFEAPRSRPYPTPAQKEPYFAALFRKAVLGMGYHPFPQPSGNLSQPYTNPEGLTLNTCVFCGFCERYGCEHFAKASPQTLLLPVLMKLSNYEMRTNCQVLRINLDSSKKKATGVTYVDAKGEEVEQPAELVLVTSYALNNARMLLLSGIGTPYNPETGEGAVGKNYAYQTQNPITVFFDESMNINPFMASGANGTMIDDFGNDNFDHSKVGFIGGAYIGALQTGARPIETNPVPPGTPPWGLGWKQAIARYYNHSTSFNIQGTSTAMRGNYLDLDPTYKDAWGLPLMRMTFDYPANDVRMSAFCTDKALEIGRAMSGQQIVSGSPRKNPYDATVYQTTHNTGGVIMGADPKTSAVNRYLQSWDVPNVFVVGASAYPQNSNYNPTGTVAALTYWAADAIKNQYLKSPGPLVPT